MAEHRNGLRGGDTNLTDVLWRQMQSVADALIERQTVLERKKPNPIVRKGVDLFIVDLISLWIDHLASEPDTDRRREMEHLLRVVGAESQELRIDSADRTMAG